MKIISVPSRPCGSKPAHIVCASGGGCFGTEKPNRKKNLKKNVTVRGSNPGGGEIFQCPFRPAIGPTQPFFAIGRFQLKCDGMR